MIISTFPIMLLFVSSGISVDVYKNKRVPREGLDIDKRTYNLNHPPLANDYDTEPSTVLYNDKDYEGKEASTTQSVLDESDTTDGRDKVISKDSDEIITIEYNFANKEALKPKPRSLSVGSQFTVAKADDSELRTSDNRNNRGRVQRRRLQQVKKTKVNDIETNVETNENTTTKVPQKKNEYTTQKSVNQTTTDRPQSTTSKSRTGTRGPVVPIIESENYVYSHSGNFHYSYEGGDGTRAFERGELKHSNDGSGTGEAVEGGFSYTDKDGNDFSLSYTADENGYRPVGVHLPTPPPIPPEIQAALRLLATKTTPEPVTERVTKS